MAAREEAHSTLGAREAQRADLGLLVELAEALNDDARRAEAAVRWASMEHLQGRPTDSLTHARTALACAEASGDRGLLVRSRLYLGIALFDLRSLDEARRLLEEALVMVREDGTRRIEASCLAMLGSILAEQGELETAHAYDQQAVELRYQLGDLLGVIRSLHNIGVQHVIEGDPVSAIASLEEALRLARQTGYRGHEGWILMNLAACALALGDFRLAQAQQSEGYRLADETEDPKLKRVLLIDTIELLHQLDQPAEAYREATRVLEAYRESASLPHAAPAWAALGLALGDLGRAVESADAYGRALTAWQEMGDAINELRARAGLARAALLQGDLKAAQTQIEQSLPRIAASALVNSISDGPFAVYLTCYRVLAAAGDPRAAGVLTQAYRLIQERAARIPDPRATPLVHRKPDRGPRHPGGTRATHG